ncbi:MAG TPA: putative lipid II flippase FtsW [Solirubrobacteraceae bacterium]|jgi:cell division protein FtsW|nr:putative lipid II flippase FtsW [Solirubrobacteraceae bacterium]
MSSSSAGSARPTAPRAGRGRASSTQRAKSAQKDAKLAPARSARAGASLEQRLLLTCTLCLLAFGLVMVYSATSATTVLQGGSGGSELIKFAIFAAVGLVAMRLLARHGIARVQGIVAPLLVLSFVLVLAVNVPGLGVSVNGARRWLGHGSLVFQPSELLKIALVLYAATLIARRPRRLLDLKELTKPLLLVVGGACLLVASQPDIGTAMVIAFTIAAMLIAAGIPMRNLGIIAGTVAALVVLYALAEPYARQRLTSFLNPWAHASGSGFQAVQGQIAIGSGGLFGVGPGRSVQKIFYLPEASTDFILAVIGEELGVVGICALLSLYGVIGYVGLRVARTARSLHSALIAVGMTSLIVSEAILNAFAVLGLAPLTGVPLPFVSAGASNLIVMLAAMGLLMNVAGGGSAHVRAVPDRRPRRSRSDAGSGKASRTPARARPQREDDAAGAKTARLGNESSGRHAGADSRGGHRGTRGARARGR